MHIGLPDILWSVRLASMDLMVTAEVLHGNCYGLPESFGRDDVIIDVGANIGAFAAACLARGAGRVLCIEPHPANLEMIYRNLSHFEKDSWKVQDRALWKEGEDTVLLSSEGCGTAMFTVLQPGQEGGIQVGTCTLDEILPDFPFRLLKLDCEGGEWPGIYESERLANAREIVAELHLSIPVPGYECTVSAALERVRSLGFRAKAWPKDEALPRHNWYLRAVR